MAKRRAMLRATVDTNTLVSALINFNPGGVSYDLLRFAEMGTFELITSPYIISEVANTLRKPRLSRYVNSDGDIIAFCQIIRDMSTIIQTWPDINAVSDPKDNAILACAIAAGADYLVSRDRHLLVLGEHDGIKIIAPEVLLAELRTAERNGGQDTRGL